MVSGWCALRSTKMKLLITSLFLAFILASCSEEVQSDSREANTPPKEVESHKLELAEPWVMLGHSIEEYIEMQPNRPIIVTYGADWCLMSHSHWRVLLEPDVSKYLKDQGYLCIVGDMTERDSLTLSQHRLTERTSLPTTGIFNPTNKTWHYLPDVFTKAELLALIKPK